MSLPLSGRGRGERGRRRSPRTREGARPEGRSLGYRTGYRARVADALWALPRAGLPSSCSAVIGLRKDEDVGVRLTSRSA